MGVRIASGVVCSSAVALYFFPQVRDELKQMMPEMPDTKPARQAYFKALGNIKAFIQKIFD